jgi:hypothetical protein
MGEVLLITDMLKTTVDLPMEDSMKTKKDQGCPPHADSFKTKKENSFKTMKD